MIGTALDIVRQELNAWFRTLQSDSRDVVVLGGLAAANDQTTNRIVLSMLHLRQDTTVRNQQVAPRGLGPRAPIAIVLHVVFVSNFADYKSGLDSLADVIGFLQARAVFDRQSTPGLDPRLDRLVFSMLNLDYSELSYAWGLLLTDFRPAAFYEVRMVALPDPSAAALPPQPTTA